MDAGIGILPKQYILMKTGFVFYLFELHKLVVCMQCNALYTYIRKGFLGILHPFWQNFGAPQSFFPPLLKNGRRIFLVSDTKDELNLMFMYLSQRCPSTSNDTSPRSIILWGMDQKQKVEFFVGNRGRRHHHRDCCHQFGLNQKLDIFS